MTIGYDRNDWKQFQIKNPVEIVLAKEDNNSILVTGVSGSGNRFPLWFLYGNCSIIGKALCT